eukprot:TRINITY_DN467_c0_g1_i1.p1 TRINITY_DN467_c0_g1~~TRINITY_DN467_c0_g1_i1.p1  ORF type:complete len:212 (-),score=47.81 TRINITY_DN467_c0_g1_i1:199-834(-)
MRRINERALVGMIVLGLVLSAVASLCGTSDTTTFTKYNTATPICLILNDTVANSGNGSYQYMTFYPEIDAYTLIHAQGSFELFHPYSTGDTSIQKLEILLEAGGQISPATGWFKFNYTVPFFTAIINLSNGKVNSISWQSGCFSEIVGDSCTLCLNDGRDCGVSNSTCGVSNTGNINVTSTTCDAKVVFPCALLGIVDVCVGVCGILRNGL